jgi:hypothetical protein
MKLARTNLSIIPFRTVDLTSQRRGRYGSNMLAQPKPGRATRTWRPSSKLVARWHTSTITGRIECRWIPDQAREDDCIFAGYSMAKRQLRLLQ